MKPIAKRPTPAAISVLRQATELSPKRSKVSDGLLPSKAHILQNPNSDHNTGLAVDLTHDPKHGMDCKEIYKMLKGDDRVSYLIFNGKIWSESKGDRPYSGLNKHQHHIHISIKEECDEDTDSWFPWMGKPKLIAKVVAKVTPKPKKK